MSLQGIVLIDLAGLGLIVLIANLVRIQKLYAGYATIWILALATLMTLVSFQPLLGLVTAAIGAIFPASTLSLLPFIFIFMMLVFVSVQLSALSARQTELVQALALRELLEKETDAVPSPTEQAGVVTNLESYAASRGERRQFALRAVGDSDEA